MKDVQPILIDRALQRALRTHADCAMVVGDALAADLMRMIDVARQHGGQDFHVAVLNDGKRETLIAHVPGAGPWTVVK